MPSSARYSLLLNIFAGAFYGYAIGFVAIYSTFNTINTDCLKVTGEAACKTLQHSECVWAEVNGSAAGQCVFSNYLTVDCERANHSYCLQLDACVFDYKKNRCQNAPAWSTVKTGLFAGALIVGGMIGSIFAGKMNDGLGRKKSIVVIAMMGLAACAMMTGARVGGYYALMIVARIVLGVACGAACVVSPSYVEEMAPPKYRGPIGTFFQISICGGIAVVAALGLGLDPPNTIENMEMEMRFHVIIAVQWLCSLALLLLGFVMPESDVWINRMEKEVSHLLNSEGRLGQKLQNDGFPVRQLLGPLIGGALLGISLQFTGINAIVNYAPTIMTSAGLTPLVGNFVVMLWNFFATLISIPVAQRFAPRSIYLVGTAAASTACVLTAIPLFPGVTSDPGVRHGVAATGIIAFVGAFQIMMGPPFYILTQRLFPAKYRSTGSSITLMIQFVANVLINFGFPSVVVALSGGPSGNQDKGLALTFIIFAACGFGCLAGMWKTLISVEEE